MIILQQVQGGSGMGFLQPWHLILILVIVLIVFGPGKMPEVGKAIGQTIKEVRKASSSVSSVSSDEENKQVKSDLTD